MHEDVTARLQARFHTLDADADQNLTADDFDGEVTRILQATNVPQDAPRARLLRSAYQAYWWALVDDLDRDGDGRISFAEYAEIVHGVDRFKSFGRARADAVDRFTDLDADGWITREDYRSVMLAARFEEGAAMAAFDAMDEAGDGRILAGRFAQLIMEFYDTIGTAGAAQRLVPHQ